jgi:hypothetical protein
MTKIPDHAPNYVPSSEISQRMGEFSQNLKTLLPYLKKEAEVFEIDVERSDIAIWKDVTLKKAPTIILLRDSSTE